MPDTTTICIQQQRTTDDTQPNAVLSFDHGVQYPIHVQDPFTNTPALEANLEWYFEDYLAFSFTRDVRARNATTSIPLS